VPRAEESPGCAWNVGAWVLGLALAVLAARVKPVVIERLVAEGRWYPYVRTLPA
jgi:hypothetical protein